MTVIYTDTAMYFSFRNVFRPCPLWPQWLAAVEIGILSLEMGIVNGWTSPYLAKLTQPNSVLFLTPEEASWIAALVGLGRMFGALFGGIAQYYISNKKTLLFTGLPIAFGWVCLILAKSVPWIYAARLSSGIAMGFFYCCYSLFIGEISHPKIRGSLCGLIMSCMPIGNLIGTLMGPYVSMQIFAAISLVPTLIYMILFMLLPESPHYLTRIEKYDEAKKSMQWYQRNMDVDYEMASLKQFIKMKDSESFAEILREMNLPKNRQAFWIIHNLFFFMQLSGIHTIYFYMEIILKNAAVEVITPSTLVYLVSAVGILSSWVALHTIDKYGRRIMMALSSAGTGLSFTLYACHYTLLRVNYYDPETLQWLSIIASFVFQIFISIGLSPIPSIILSEIFPPNIKSTAACIISVFGGFYAFVSSKTYQPLVDITSVELVLFLYALLMILQCIFCLWCLPETKGKSLQEIQEMLAKRKPER